MTVTIRCCEPLPVPPAVVWADIERIDTHPEWMRDAVRIEFRSDERRGVGAEFVCVTRIGPLRTQDRLVVTEWVPARLLAIRHEGHVQGVGRFSLRPVGVGAELCWEETLRFPWWMGGPVGERLARPVLARTWRANLARLRRRLAAR